MPAIAENIKKVAVVKHGVTTQFIELDQGRPLAAVIRDLCTNWVLEEPDDYALQFNEPSKKTFITERNRVEITNGNVLKLSFSPSKTAQELLHELNHTSASKRLDALRQLSFFSQDITFAQEFINKKGLYNIIECVESGNVTGDALSYILKAFLELMEHGIVSWDVLEHKFIKTVANQVTARGCPDASTLQSSLEILENIVLNSSGKYSLVEQELTPVSLIHHLQSGQSDDRDRASGQNFVIHVQSYNREIQKNAIALINALFFKATKPKRKKITEELQSKSIRNIILNVS